MSAHGSTARALMMRFIVGERLRIAGAVAAGVLTILSSVCLLAVSAYLIERASQRPPILSLEVAIVSVRFFGISRGVFRYIDRYLSHDASFRLLGDIRADIYQRLIPLAPAGLERFGRGDLLARVAADVDTMQEWFVRGFAPVATSTVTAAILVVAATIILPLAGLVLLLSLVVAAAAMILVTRARHGAGCLELDLRGDVTAGMVDYVQGIADLTAMGAASVMAARIEATERHRSRLYSTRARRNAFSAGLQSALPGLIAAGLGATAIAALAGGLNPLQVGVLVFGGMGASECVMAVSPAVGAWERGYAAAARLAATTAPAGFVVPSGEVTLETPPRSLTVSNVSFRYATDSTWVLRDLSLEVSTGDQIVIVGRSGAGKSTLASLLLRFLSPTDGSIAINGLDLADLSERSVRKACGAATQHAHLFTGTVLENIHLARPEADDDQVRVTVERAQLAAWIDSLPAGWNTQVGERGSTVSGGQRRRIALARALLAGFPILIADEPTEGLDGWTARGVMDTLFAQSSDKALIVITHRPDLCPPEVPIFELVDGTLRRRSVVAVA